EPGMHQAVVERQRLRADIDDAVAGDQFILHYQPLVELATGRLAGAEALVRWEHPTRGLVFPDRFIADAEASGRIVEIGQLTLLQACREARRWHDRFGDTLPLVMNVNLSPRQLHQADFVDRVRAALEATGADPSALVLEITESVLVGDAEGTIAGLQGLRDLGVRVALDDFGTGFSSLQYLVRLPVDTLKVAKQFVDGLGKGDRETALAHAIVRMGQTMGMSVIAEGIERAEQVELLRQVACDYGQGYLFGLPCDGPEMEAMLVEGRIWP
ncbi:MAG: putative bifunctional diguanylate cyclase/phosphodiesterase, partial [Acidimicrobiales bacterium]